MPDQDGYPTNAELETLVEIASTVFFNEKRVIDFLKEIWHWPEMVRFDGRKLTLITGGWSGNEDIIKALSTTTFWLLCWQKSERGGCHEFEIKGRKKMIKGYKGFDKDLKCRGFQYEVGKEYEENNAKRCEGGFHFCENPLDVFNYYSPADSRYCEVEGDGVIDKQGYDTKVAASKIRIGVEVGLPELIKAGVEYIKSKVDWENKKETNTGDYSAATNTGNMSAATNTGDYSAATNTGDYSAATNTGNRSAAINTGYQSAATNTGGYSVATNTGNMSAATNTGDYSAATNTGNRSAATNTGYQSAATNTGDYSVATNTGNRSAAINTGYQSAAINTGNRSAATVEGKESIACALGFEGKAKGKQGCWLVLAEWKYIDNERKLIGVRSVNVDGETIKEGTFYSLVNGEVKEIEGEEER